MIALEQEEKAMKKQYGQFEGEKILNPSLIAQTEQSQEELRTDNALSLGSNNNRW